MSLIEIDRLLQTISPEAPSGENLEYDPAYMELERDIEGTPAIEVDGRVVQEAKQPNWSRIGESAFELLTRTHDLRVAIFFTRALLYLQGLDGFHHGLKLLYGYADRYWDTLHPQLDPDDGNDPTERVNIIESLCDWNTIIAPLMKVELCASRTVSNINLRNYRIATGNIEEFTVPEEDKANAPSLAGIEGAFAECPLQEAETNKNIAASSLGTLQALVAALEEKVGSARAPDLNKLNQVLKEIHNLLAKQLSGRLSIKPSTPEGDDPVALRDSWGQNSASQGFGAASDVPDRMHCEQPALSTGGRSSEVIEKREDVIHALDRVCKYYEHFEPSSPVPILLKRAMRLVAMDFLEIIEDLAPESLERIQALRGKTEDNQ